MSDKKISFFQWNRTDWLILLIVSIPIVLFIFFYQELPEQLAIHFGVDGKPDGYQGKLSFLIVDSFLLIIIPFGLKLLAYIDPRKENYVKFERALTIIRLITAWLLSVTSLLVILINLGSALNIQLIILFAVGLLFLVLGNYLGQIRPNYFVGIRTPWTLANEEVWRRTHRLGGPLLMVTGLILIITAFISAPVAIWLSGLSILLSILVLTIYSYILYAKINRDL